MTDISLYRSAPTFSKEAGMTDISLYRSAPTFSKSQEHYHFWAQLYRIIRETISFSLNHLLPCHWSQLWLHWHPH